MHGAIMYGLERFVQQRFGRAVWADLQQHSAFRDMTFVPSGHYPDEELVSMIARLSRQTGVDLATLQEELGAALVPALVQLYGAFIDPQWRTLELVENTERTIHRVIRMHDPDAAPPALRCQRLGPDRVRVIYQSGRRLCAVARGISRGVAQHYGEQLVVREPRCMLRGDPHCEIDLERVARAPRVAA